MAWNQVGVYHAKGRKLEWLVRWYGEINPETGKPKRYSKSFRIKRDADDFKVKKAAEIKKTGRRDRPVDHGVGKLCRDFLRAKKTTIRPATLDLYKYNIGRLLDFFGPDRPLSQITPKEVDLFLGAQVNQKNPDKRLSAWTRSQIMTNCRTIFATAMRWGLIDGNPFADCDKPKKRLNAWHHTKPDEYLRLLQQAPDARWRALYAMVYTAGLRSGELFSLTWANIDFEEGMVRVDNRAGTPTMPPFALKDYEKREVPLPNHTINILLNWQAEAPEGSPYILLTPERYQRVLRRWKNLRMADHLWENRFMVNNVLRNLKVHARRAEIAIEGEFTMHTLRKSFGQNMANNGMPIKTLQYLMGHSDEKTTLTYYTKLDQSSTALAKTTTDRFLRLAEQNLDAQLTRKGDMESPTTEEGKKTTSLNACDQGV